MSNGVNFIAFTQDVSFTDTIAELHRNPTYCGARSYTLSPPHTFLSISGTTMILQTSIPSDEGTYPITLVVGLTSYPGVAILTKRFSVTITCEVLSLTF